MAEVQKISPDWAGEPCIVAAPGPSLTEDVAQRVRKARWFDRWRVLAVQDAYRLMPWADAMYGCDEHWWKIHKDCAGFAGEKWSTHDQSNDKRTVADAYKVRIVKGKDGDVFSTDPSVISYGSNSGFQAVNLALLKGCKRIALVGFDMRRVDGKSHFFGDHPAPCHNRSEYDSFILRFERAAKHLPADVSIVNATPGSALKCFPMMPLEDVLAAYLQGTHGLPDRHRPDADAGADRDGTAQRLCAGGM